MRSNPIAPEELLNSLSEPAARNVRTRDKLERPQGDSHMDATLWRDLLHPDVSILEKIIRPILVYFFLIIGLRVAGRRELAQLNAFDLVVLLTLSNTVQN